MRIAVLGATGRTGKVVVDQALARGDAVVAVVRRPDAVAPRHNLAVRAADALDQSSLREALADADAVVSALGFPRNQPAYAASMRAVLDALDGSSASRLSAISASPAGPREEMALVERSLMLPVLDRFFGQTYADLRAMEAVLAAGPISWVAVRPPRLVDKAATGRYRLDGDHPLRDARSIRRADLATSLLDVLAREDIQRRAVYVAN